MVPSVTDALLLASWFSAREVGRLPALAARLPGPVDPVEVLPVDSEVQQD